MAHFAYAVDLKCDFNYQLTFSRESFNISDLKKDVIILLPLKQHVIAAAAAGCY